MAKYLVESYYNCTFKISHYLDEINGQELNNLEKREDGKFEIIDVKLDNRKTKNLNGKNNSEDNKGAKIDIVKELSSKTTKTKNTYISNKSEVHKRFSMPDRRKGYIQKA